METSRRNSSISSIAMGKSIDLKKQFLSGACTFVRLIHSDNQQILLNSYASCRRLLDHLKSIIGVQQDDTIDLMDNEGKLKELNTHADEYASIYLTPRSTYYAFKIDTLDASTNQKNYTACFNMDQLDTKLHSILLESMKTLNSSTKTGKPKRPIPGSSKPTPSAQLSSTTTQARNKRNQKKN